MSMELEYKGQEKGCFFPAQSDLNWAQTFRMTLRAPAIANRIFDTLAHAQSYIDDTTDKASAVPGLILVVLKDGDNNGVYQVLSVKETANGANGTLKRIDERTVFEVANITTKLESYTTPGIYFFVNTTTNKGYVLFVESESGSVIQSIMNADGIQYRTKSNNTWSNWQPKYTTSDEVTISGEDNKKLTDKLTEMLDLIYAAL